MNSSTYAAPARRMGGFSTHARDHFLGADALFQSGATAWRLFKLLWACFAEVLVVLLLVIPPTYYLSGDASMCKAAGLAFLATFVVVNFAAPWYTLLTVLPLLVCLGVFCPAVPGGLTPNPGYVILTWLWALFPLTRAAFRIPRWEYENIMDTPHTQHVKHGWLLGLGWLLESYVFGAAGRMTNRDR